MGRKKNTNQFIEDARRVHGDKYDYSKTIYVNAQKKVIITCPIHGDFMQTPNSHLYGRGCPECGKIKAGENIKKAKKEKPSSKTRRKKEDIIKEIYSLYGDKYDLSKMIYKDNKTKVCLICPEHGEFWKTPTNLLYGKQGCPKCGHRERNKSKTKTTEDFINQANYIHFGIYDYSNTIYTKARNKVKIICPIHGEFEQMADNHLKGCGCPYCQSSRLERNVRRILEEEKITFIQKYVPEWLKSDKSHYQSLDFYLPEYNIAIECQGMQHLKPCGNFGSKKVSPVELYENVCRLDDRKNALCKKNGINIIYYFEDNIEYRYHVCRNKNELLNFIFNKI